MNNPLSVGFFQLGWINYKKLNCATHPNFKVLCVFPWHYLTSVLSNNFHTWVRTNFTRISFLSLCVEESIQKSWFVTDTSCRSMTSSTNCRYSKSGHCKFSAVTSVACFGHHNERSLISSNLIFLQLLMWPSRKWSWTLLWCVALCEL